MSAVQRKICLLGATSVGKTSLVRRFVESMFSERYQATIGVKIDRKVVRQGGHEISLAIWDLQGTDELERVRASYLRGAAGALIVADGTRPDTLEIAGAVRTDLIHSLGDVPVLLLLNKCDLVEEWRVDDAAVSGWRDVPVLRTSAKTGERVEHAFSSLVDRIQAT